MESQRNRANGFVIRSFGSLGHAAKQRYWPMGTGFGLEIDLDYSVRMGSSDAPSQDSSILQANLERMLHRFSKTPASDETNDVAQRMPLSAVYGNDFLRDELASSGKAAKAMCQQRRAEAGRGSGNGQFVYFYVGPARRAYTNLDRLARGDGRVAIVVAASVETEGNSTAGARAFPWDSGEVMSHWEGERGKDDAARWNLSTLLRDAQLPVPEYRRVLAGFIQMCFESPDRYLVGWQRPLQSGVDALDDAHASVINESLRRRFGQVEPYPPGWTFEVSFKDQLILGAHVMAVFITKDAYAILTPDQWRLLCDTFDVHEVVLPEDPYEWRYVFARETARYIAGKMNRTLPLPYLTST